eukprot:PhF_6_TR15050/c0_g1_i1/m.23624
MGNRATRETHLMKYGATTKDLEVSYAMEPSAQDNPTPTTYSPEHIAHLSQPRHRRAKFTRPKSGLLPEDNPQSMDNVFPALPPTEQHTHTVVPYPMDWRQRPIDGSAMNNVTWVYTAVDLTKQDVEVSFATAQAAVEKLLASNGCHAVSSNTTREDVRALIRSSARFGVLVDIIATRRCILSGSPHEIGLKLYEHMDNAYPISVKFCLVGITDNTAKRVARDMFCNVKKGVFGVNRQKLTFSSHKAPLDTVDGDHTYIVGPGDKYQVNWVKSRGDREETRQRAARFRRYFTPKYERPPDPEWLQKLKLKQQQQQSQLSMSSSSSTPSCLPPTLTVQKSPGTDRQLSLSVQSRSPSSHNIDVPPPPDPGIVILGEVLNTLNVSEKEISTEVRAREIAVAQRRRNVEVDLKGLEVEVAKPISLRSGDIGTRGNNFVASAENTLKMLQRRSDDREEELANVEARRDVMYADTLLEVLRRVKTKQNQEKLQQQQQRHTPFSFK